MNRIVSVLMVMLVAVIVFNVYMSVSLSSNTTGWSTIMINTIQQYLPLLALVAVLIFVIGAALISNSKKG